MKATSFVSFDFDGILSNNDSMIALVKGFIKNGHPVMILTSRKNEDMDEVKEFADSIGLEPQYVYNTDYLEKNVFLNKLASVDLKNQIGLHIDDDLFEVQALRSIGVSAIYIPNTDCEDPDAE